MIRIFDKDMVLLTEVVEATTEIWQERFFDPTYFEFVFLQNFPTAKYIDYEGYDELGIIVSKSLVNGSINYKGYSEVWELNNVVISQTMNYANKTVDYIVYNLFETFADKSIKVVQLKTSLPVIESLQVTGENLFEYIKTLLQPYNCGFFIQYNFETSEREFLIREAVDATLTKEPLEITADNILSESIEQNEETYKNFAYVAGAGEGTARRIVEVDLSNGEKQRQLWVDARDFDETDLTETEIKAAMHQRGVEALEQYQKIENVAIEVPTSQDIVLGEIRTFKNTSYGIFTERIITDVSRSREAGTLMTAVVLGGDLL